MRGWEPASSTRCRQRAEGTTYPAGTAKFDPFIEKEKRTATQTSGSRCRGDEHSTMVLRARAPQGLDSANGRCRGCQKQPPVFLEQGHHPAEGTAAEIPTNGSTAAKPAEVLQTKAGAVLISKGEIMALITTSPVSIEPS